MDVIGMKILCLQWLGIIRWDTQYCQIVLIQTAEVSDITPQALQAMGDVAAITGTNTNESQVMGPIL